MAFVINTRRSHEFCKERLGVEFKSLEFDHPDREGIMDYILSLVWDDDGYERFMKQMKRLREPVIKKYNIDYVEKLLKQIRENPQQINKLVDRFLIVIHIGASMNDADMRVAKDRSFRLEDI